MAFKSFLLRTLAISALALSLSGCGILWSNMSNNQSLIWIFGGFDGSSTYNSVYTSADGGKTWLKPQGAAMPGFTSSGGVVLLGNVMYYIGGTDSTGNFDTTQVWATQNGVTWNTSGSLPAVRGDALTLTFQNCMFEIGGTANDEGAGAINTVQKSCDGGLTWNTVGTLTTSVFLPCGVVYNNQMWIIGGAAGPAWTLYNQVYSSSDGVTWTLQGTYPSNIYACKATVFNNAIYVAGGSNTNFGAGPPLSSVYSSTNGSTWNLVGNMPAPRSNGSLITYNNNLIYIGGAATTWQTGLVTTVFSSPTGATGSWTTYNSLPAPLSFFDNAVVF